MKKKVLALLLVATMLVIWQVPAFADEKPLVTGESLLDIVKPNIQNLDGDISRGVFSYILVNAAKLSDSVTVKSSTLPLDLKDVWYKDAIMILWENGIMKGAHDGNVYPEDPITLLQAKTLVARTFGISDEVIFNKVAITKNDIDQELYSFIAGYFKGNDNDHLSVKDAAKVLSDVFNVDSQAKDIILKSDEATKKAKSFKTTGNIEIGIGLSQQDSAIPTKVNLEFSSEFSADNKIKQEMNGIVPGLNTPISMTQYIDKDYIYTMMTGQKGEPQWMKVKNPVPFAFDDEFMESKKNEMLNVDVELPYKVLGEETIDGKQCYKLGFYTRINDANELLKTFDAIPGMDDTTKELLEESAKVIENLLFRGIMYIGEEDYLVYRTEISYDIALNDEVQKDSPNKIKSMGFTMDMNYSDYGKDIKIEIPKAAMDAEEIAPGAIEEMEE